MILDDQWLILIKLKQSEYYILPNKIEVVLKDVTVFVNEHKFYIVNLLLTESNTAANHCQICILRQNISNINIAACTVNCAEDPCHQSQATQTCFKT